MGMTSNLPVNAMMDVVRVTSEMTRPTWGGGTVLTGGAYQSGNTEDLQLRKSIEELFDRTVSEYSESCPALHCHIVLTPWPADEDLKELQARERARQIAELRLPVELWMLVIQDIIGRDLRHLSLVCKAFRALARPRLYESLTIDLEFRPTSSCPLSDPSGKPLVAPEYHKRVERLRRLWCRPAIAPYVQRCTMIGVAFRFSYMGDEALLAQSATYTRAAFALAPHWAHLRVLTCDRVQFDAGLLGSLRTLRALDTIFFSDCGIAGPERAIPSVPQLATVRHADIDYRMAPVHALTLVAVEPDAVERLSLNVDHRVASGAIALASVLPPVWARRTFPVLRELHVPVSTTHDRLFVSFLGRCPQLEKLTISPAMFMQQHPGEVKALPPRVLAKLVTFHGPDTYVHLLERTMALQHVHLWNPFYCTDTSTLVDLLKRSADIAPTLKTLSVESKYVNDPLWEAIAGFTSLERLVIRVAFGRSPPANEAEVGVSDVIYFA